MNTTKLQEYRSKAGLTYEQIAEATGISVRTVSTIFTNPEYNPSLDTAVSIVSVIGASLDDVCDFQIPPKDITDNAGNVNMSLLEKVYQSFTQLLVEAKSHTQEVRRWLKASVGLNVAFLALIVFVVIFDITHPTMGYVQYTVQRITSAWNHITDMFTL